MKKVLLSSDGPAAVYCVPDEVADHLDAYCWEFAADWIWKDPNGAKLLKEIRGQKVAVYGAQDFIDYLNQWRFPDQPSFLVERLDCCGYEVPKGYRQYPQYHF